MADAIHDQNRVTNWQGVSCVDGITPINIVVDSTTGGFGVDSTTTMSVSPSAVSVSDKNWKHVIYAEGTDGSVYPLYVNPANGKVLIST